jgi:ribosomal protein L13
MAARNTPVTADDVRNWARGKGMSVAEHGRLSFDVVSAFNKTHKRQYTPTLKAPARVVTISGKKLDSKGRVNRASYTVQTSEIREWARANGFEVGARGRFSAEILTAFGSRELVS